MKLEELAGAGVFFHTTGKEFCYSAISLASGLHQLGIPVYGNIRYSNPLVSEFQFEPIPAGVQPGLMVIDLREGTFNPDLPFKIEGGHRNTHVLAVCDSVDSLNYQCSLPLHRGHCNRLMAKPYPYHAVGFGVSDRLLNHCRNFQYPERREEVILRNFRSSGNQFLRMSLELSLLPMLESRIAVDRRMTQPTGRYDNAFLDRLGQSLMCLSYGGNYVEDNTEYYRGLLAEDDPRKGFLTSKHVYSTVAVARWDSWRFWESLCMGSVAIQLDFEKYGFELPVMPVNWVHYVGLSLENLKEDVERLFDERDRLGEIAENGKNWAIEHYAPMPVAKRFLGIAGVEL